MPVIPKPLQIICSRVLLVEGNDELNFFTELLKEMNVELNKEIETRVVGGKDKFHAELPAFLNDPNFSSVKAYAILRDADNNAKGALESIQKILKDKNQPCPKDNGTFAANASYKVGIYILPGKHAEQGMLEDLCLSSVRDHPLMPHVDNYMVQVKQIQGSAGPKNMSKARLQVFLAGMPKTDERLGMAAKWKYWKFDNEAFVEIRSFLAELLAI